MGLWERPASRMSVVTVAPALVLTFAPGAIAGGVSAQSSKET